MRFLKLLTFGIGIALLPTISAAQEDLSYLNLPKGFKIETWVEVPGARSMVVTKAGDTVYVGTRGASVYKISIDTQTLKARQVVEIADDLHVANGITLDDQDRLVIAEQHRVIRFSNDGQHKVLVAPGLLPDRRHHGWRYAAFGPDKALYVAVGAPCNICKVSGVEGTILRFDPKNFKPQIYAKGVRNSVGFDWHPATKEMFFTDNGGDNIGDNIPPDELNRATRPGQHFGYPYSYLPAKPYPQFSGQSPGEPITHPEISFAAHVASLGIDFYEGEQFPKSFSNDAFVAQHGSWNRTVPIGYRIMHIDFNPAGDPVSNTVFIDGWLRPDGEVKGRPVDVEELPDGSLLISDDYADVIYRVTYQGS